MREVDDVSGRPTRNARGLPRMRRVVLSLAVVVDAGPRR
jgi:hypothetical protein